MVFLGIKTVLAVIVTIATFAAETSAFEWGSATSVASNAFVYGGNDFHFRY